MNLYEAIYQRRSVRNYSMEALDEKAMAHINNFINTLRTFRDNIEYELKIVDNVNGEGDLGGLFQVKAPYYLILSSELKTDYLINAGFIMQQMVLYLTAMNIGSCYQGSVKVNQKLKSKITYDYVIAIAFGKSPRSIYRLPNKAKRLDEENLTVFKEEVDDQMKTILSAAIFSPSSMNNQPWRFVVYKNRIHVFCKKARFFSAVPDDMKLMDIGVMLANISQAAEELWLNDTYVDMDSIKEKTFKNNEYITTVTFKEKVFL